jgi:hypothetical protein
MEADRQALNVREKRWQYQQHQRNQRNSAARQRHEADES